MLQAVSSAQGHTAMRITCKKVMPDGAMGKNGSCIVFSLFIEGICQSW